MASLPPRGVRRLNTETPQGEARASEGAAPPGTEVFSPPERTPWRAAISWCLHDLANTIFSAVVVTVYLPLYARAEIGHDWPAGVIGTLSMVCAALVVPVLGGLVDRTGRAKGLLTALYFTYSLLAVGMSLAGMLPGAIGAVLGFFAVANFCYQASLVPYNSLLTVVCAPRQRGLVSGLGVGLGYLGQPLALGLAYLVVRWWEMSWTFALAGVLVVLFSTPLQLWVPERRVASPRPLSRQAVRNEYAEVLRTLRSLPRMPDVAWFLAGNFLCVDVLNTAIFWIGVYLVHGMGMDQGTMIQTIVIANLTAFVIGSGLGWITDRVGARQTMILAACCLLAALVSLVATRDPLLARLSLWTLGAAGLGGIWVAGRKLLLDLVPADRVGAFFGLYGLTNKGAAFGLVAFAVLSDWFGYRVALTAAILPLAAGILALSRVGRRPLC